LIVKILDLNRLCTRHWKW